MKNGWAETLTASQDKTPPASRRWRRASAAGVFATEANSSAFAVLNSSKPNRAEGCSRARVRQAGRSRVRFVTEGGARHADITMLYTAEAAD